MEREGQRRTEDGRTDGRTVGVDGRTDGRTDGREHEQDCLFVRSVRPLVLHGTDGRTDGRTESDQLAKRRTATVDYSEASSDYSEAGSDYSEAGSDYSGCYYSSSDYSEASSVRACVWLCVRACAFVGVRVCAFVCVCACACACVLRAPEKLRMIDSSHCFTALRDVDSRWTTETCKRDRRSATCCRLQAKNAQEMTHDGA